MKRNIQVNDRELIDKLNRNINGKKTYEKPESYVWDNNGPVQFEEEKTEKLKNTVTLTPRLDDGRFDNRPCCETEYSEEDTAEARESLKNINDIDLMKKAGGYLNSKEGTRPRTYSEALDNLRKAEQERVDRLIKHIIEERKKERDYEEVNHPDHYNQYDVEVIDMMERVFGKEETAIFCKLNAFKYRQRMGNKPGQDVLKDLAKEKWYLDKKKELEQK